MSERTRNGKSFTQDLTGLAFCLVGGIFAVSIVRFLGGHEPKESMRAFVQPVLGLVATLGSPGALVFSVGLAALGVILFVRNAALAPLRPLGALVLGALGLALLAGAFGYGGTLGSWLPGLLGGVLGRAIGVILGAALAWLGWMLAFPPSTARESTAEAIQRIGLSSRQDAAGVSPAEAALLVPETRPLAKAVAAPPREEPLRIETIRPRAAPAEARPQGQTAPAAKAYDPAPSALAPPAPSWEVEDDAETEPEEEPVFGLPIAAADEVEEADELDDVLEDELDEELDEDSEEAEPIQAAGDDLETLRASRADVFAQPEADEAEEEDQEEEEDEAKPELESLALVAEEELADARDTLPPEPAVPAAAWEQVGLFDDLDEPAPAPAAELTPSFDFDAPAPAPAPAAATRAPVASQAKEPADIVLTPVAPKPAPVVARDEDRERWETLVFDSGCLILEQKRVAVSMLERRFGIDFNRACKVLDELQQAGLIGPYIGGRSRDILLTREEWLPHAPHA